MSDRKILGTITDEDIEWAESIIEKREAERLIDRFRNMFNTEHVRILRPLNETYYLIIGEKKHTKDQPGQWVRNGKPYDFEYVDEKCVASGDTHEELIDDAKYYLSLKDMSWKEYFERAEPEKDNGDQ